MEYIALLTGHVTPHASYVTPHASHVTPHASHVTPHACHVTPHACHVTCADAGADGGSAFPASTAHISREETAESEDHLQEQTAGV